MSKDTSVFHVYMEQKSEFIQIHSNTPMFKACFKLIFLSTLHEGLFIKHICVCVHKER